jgi:hypothetical protein
MRKIILTAISILSLVIMVSTNSAAAEKRRLIFEMGESGQTVSFPMTSEEIADHEVDIEGLMQIGASISQTIAPRFITFEMGESGQAFSFPIASEDIKAENSNKPRISGIRKKSTVDERQPVIYEMAESGVLIEFFKPTFKNQTANLARVE